MARRNPTSLRERMKTRRDRPMTSEASGETFKGRVGLKGPSDGTPVKSGSHVMLSLLEASVLAPGSRARDWEMQLDIATRSSTAEGRERARIWSSGLMRHSPDGSPLELRHVVLFDGEVNQHLSLDIEFFEIDQPQGEGTHPLTRLVVGAATSLLGAPAGAATLASSLPALLGGVMRLNADDQLLKVSTSLHTEEACWEGAPALRTGRWEITRHAGETGDGGLVRLLLQVRILATQGVVAPPRPLD